MNKRIIVFVIYLLYNLLYLLAGAYIIIVTVLYAALMLIPPAFIYLTGIIEIILLIYGSTLINNAFLRKFAQEENQWLIVKYTTWIFAILLILGVSFTFWN
ncbi:hypothetical protein CLV51_103373 [Chitinophaga niastensis]|uniref:Uncharacterized protein n=1 Tax=Chitinophaga niastensis TaxID=536980 RepID=A0A2P8HJL8_CHINA|nr:hypothetical protein [Chitinophaga niastensis]PSL46395.1 hypothetical protein CLV51_103373 [Chitinophaga niastensis]